MTAAERDPQRRLAATLVFVLEQRITVDVDDMDWPMVRRRLRALARRRIAAEQRREEIMDETRPLVRRARALGHQPLEIGNEAGMSRQAIYGILGKDPNDGPT